MKIMRLIYNLVFCLRLGALGLIVFSASLLQAQSISQNYPTPITTNEISGSLPARDIGDARLTAYFYTFNAVQGDVFINVVTKNLNGDIDVFTQDNLRPLTKITVYADASEGETGRVIYLRQPAKLILRIEGRTPNDDAATYRIKFAGSFAPSTAVTAENQATELPIVKSDNQTDVRVNSVGTIIEVKPKPTPTPREVIAEARRTEREAKERAKEETEIREPIAEKEKSAEAKTEKERPVETQTEIKPEVVITDELPKKDRVGTEVVAETKKDQAENAEEKPDETATEKTIVEEKATAKTEPKKPAKPKSVKSVPAAELENIRLIVLFKDGTRIERPMSEVLRVGVDRGVLTVISKDGAIGRYSILDVEKMTIE